MDKNYYQILGVDQEVSLEGIKKAYRELAHKFHPDKNSEEGSHEKFMELKEAYDILSNPSKRQSYNNLLNGVTASDALTQRYEQVRQKRASRYRRSSYQRRFTYRGNASGPQATQNRKSPFHTSPEDTSRYDSYFERSEENAQKGYRYFGIGLKVVLGGVFLICLGLMTDLWLAKELPEEQILSKQHLPWTLSEPGMVRISTENHSFTIQRSYAGKVYTWQMIRIKVSPFRKVVTRLIIEEPKLTYSVKTGESLGGFPLVMVWTLLLTIPLLFWKKIYPETLVYLGTFQVLLFIVLVGLLSK